MAENSDGSEKSEEPTAKRIEDARKKGQIPRSKELTTVLMTLSAAVFLLMYGGVMIQDIIEIMSKGLSFQRDVAFDEQKLFTLIISIIVDSIYMILPFILLMVLIALVAPTLLGGWSFSVKAMGPKSGMRMAINTLIFAVL